MPKFEYTAKTRQSQIKRGIIEASSQQDAVRKIQAQGLFVSSIRQFRDEKSAASKKQRARHRGIKVLDLAVFARQTGILLNSGVNLLRCLEITSAQCESGRLKVILQQIVKYVESGMSLTNALEKYPKVFDTMWLGLVETGEASGNLSGVLSKLADYLEMRMEFNREIITALVYPAILFFAASGALFFFTVFIIPKFSEIFEQFNITLPVLTRFLFSLSKFMQANILWVILTAAGAAYALKWWKSTPAGRDLLDRIKLKVPMIKDFSRTSALEKFASEASILLESGVSIIYTLEVVQRSIGNVVLEQMLEQIKEKVRGGAFLSEQLAITGFFPPMILEMIKIGEEVGNLSEMFAKISQHYQKELSTRIKRFVAMFEPLMVLFMGGVIGTIVISLFMPLFQIATAGGH